ncbi:DUF4917 family protein [Cronobacter turicensis]
MQYAFFYPHGSLVLCRNRIEHEHKIHIRGAGQLESILERWQSEENSGNRSSGRAG